MEKLKKYIFDPENADKVKFTFGVLLSLTMSFLLLSGGASKNKVSKLSSQNMNVMIPEGYVLFPFTAQNYDEIDRLLEAYSLVKVYDVNKGLLIAENIKVLRAPRDPKQLAFLIPTEIANKFIQYGMDFRLALQKFTNEKPKLITKNPASGRSNKKVVTYGE